MTKTVTSVLSIPNKLENHHYDAKNPRNLKMGWISVEIIGVTRFSSFANDGNLHPVPLILNPKTIKRNNVKHLLWVAFRIKKMGSHGSRHS